MPERVESIRCRHRVRKGVAQVIPIRPLHLRPGDWAEHVHGSDGKHAIHVHRAGFFKHHWARLRGEAPGEGRPRG